MTTLSQDANRTFGLGDRGEFPVIAADIIYKHAAVGLDGSGNARPLQAGDPFVGFAEKQIDNSTGSAGDRNVRTFMRGAVELPVASVAATNVGADVYASDDDTFVLTESSNTRIGSVRRFVSSGVAIVEFDAVRSTIAELTDSSGGTASGTIAAIGGTYSQSEVANAIASLAAKVNSLTRRLGN